MVRNVGLLPARCRMFALGLLLLATIAANAGSVQNIGLYDGGNAPIVEIAYTGNSGEWVYGDAQTASNLTYSNGASIPLYCIDLQHDNYLGSSYQLTAWTNPNSYSSDAINRVAWAIENTSLSGFGPAATQLLVWSLIDPNFSVINWNGNGSLETAYAAIGSRMAATYNPEISYLSNVSFYDAVHEPASYMNQDLAYDPNSFSVNLQSVPEPAGVVNGSIGALGLILLVWLRRLRGTA
jgi:hypothetical protein